jgi:EAL domain-containing protein (putative c-di-GMP-specific phosphodiesterase class I)
MVPPNDFIPLAERTSRIVEIDEEVRRQACRQAVAWHEAFPRPEPLFMSVNLSGRELSAPDLPTRIARLLEEAELDPTALMIEVTETFFVRTDEENVRQLGRLKDQGIRIALDDFGTAYSSLGYLQRFPVDVIKLDKSFTDDIPGGARGLRLIEAVGKLARDMGAIVEAEGIETQEQADALLELGWDLGQGYLYSRPVAAAAITDLLQAQAQTPG